nr:glycosyltransferase [Helicobacter bilis]
MSILKNFNSKNKTFYPPPPTDIAKIDIDKHKVTLNISLDNTAESNLTESTTNNKVKIISLKLSRNCGHQNALLAGLEYVADKCDCAISIDCDLQDDISVFDEFVAKAKMGAEVIYGVRKSRQKDSFFKKHTALGFYRLMEIMGVKITYNHADYRLLSNRAIKALLRFSEVNLFLRGIVPLLGFQTAVVEYDRLERFAGESKYPLGKMLSFAWNGITSFSVVPLRLVSVLGIVFFILSITLGCYALFVKLFTDGVVYGWASTIIPLCFFSGIQLLSLGIIGEYVGKIYAESKRRPRYFVEEII